MAMPQVVVTSFGHSLPAGMEERMKQDPLPPSAAGTHSFIETERLNERLQGHLTLAEMRRLDKLTKSALLAALDCMQASGLAIDEENTGEVGCVFNTVYGPLSVFKEFIDSGLNNPGGLGGASALLFPYTVMNAASGVITSRLKATGFNTTLTGYNPVAYAFDAIQAGKAAALLTGGFDELTPELVEAYDPAVPHLTEGSAMVLLEDGERARQGGRRPLFKVLGYAVGTSLPAEGSVDNYAVVDTRTLERVMARVYETAGVSPASTGLVLASGRDVQQKQAEAEVLRRFWSNGHAPTVLYPKDVVGDAFAANDLVVFPLLSHYLDAHPEALGEGAPHVLINLSQVGGNLTSLLLKR
jgi:3-oxoacyl-(acyl-carrier-protein) synthase